MPVLGFWDLIVIFFLALLVFGPKRLPQMGRSVGGSIRGFKDALTARHEQQDAEAERARQAETQPAQLPQGRPPAPAAPPAQPVLDPREHDTVL